MGAIALDWSAMSRMTPAVPLQPRPDMVGLVKRAWLLLYTEGGWWTESEVRHRLRLPTEIHKALREMVESGQLARKSVTNIDCETSVQYAVVRRCKVPRGVTVDELWEVLTGRPE